MSTQPKPGDVFVRKDYPVSVAIFLEHVSPTSKEDEGYDFYLWSIDYSENITFGDMHEDVRGEYFRPAEESDRPKIEQAIRKAQNHFRKQADDAKKSLHFLANLEWCNLDRID